MPRFVITRPRRFITFVFVLVAVIAGLVFYGATRGGRIEKTGEVVIAEGDSAQEIWEKLRAQELTSSVWPWRYAAYRAAAAAALQVGTYQLETGETPAVVIRRMVAGDVVPDELSVTYPEGFTLQQMAARTAARGVSNEKDFIAAAQPAAFSQQYSYLKDLPAQRTLEGYLFPDTYRVSPDDGPEDLLRRQVANFDEKFTEDLRAQAAEQGRTIDEIVIMASIVEREVIHDEDMAMVAGVLWKRLDEEMGLDADATIRYAVDNWESPLTVEELAVDSPYNTRRYRGLPPGPISNPGLRALVAAVRPQESEFYYYLSTPDGETIFSKTNDEHNANKARYLR